MAFIVITSAEAFDAIVDDGEMPHLLALGAELVLVRPLFDELARDEQCGDYIRDHSPPFVVVESHPAARVYGAVTDYMNNTGKDRIDAGEKGVIVTTDAGQWFVSRRPSNLLLTLAIGGMTERIKGHFDGADR